MRRFFSLLSIVMLSEAVFASPVYPASYSIVMNSDDGTEVNATEWFEDGFLPPANAMGRCEEGDDYSAGFRFHLEDLAQGEQVACARLRLSSRGGEVTSSASLLIEGVLQESPTTFSAQERPSQKIPKTSAKVEWVIEKSWVASVRRCPLYYESPNISSIVNEIISLPGWGSGPEGKTMIITITDQGSAPGELNLLEFEDYWSDSDIRNPAVLEIYRSVYDTFVGKEFLGSVTDTSATVNVISLIDTDVRVVYGTEPDIYTDCSEVYLGHPAGKSLEISIGDLLPDTRYYYRLVYKAAGEDPVGYSEERNFHTQRSRAAEFMFTVQTDEHLREMYKIPPDLRGRELYRTTLSNIGNSRPDFFISLGDMSVGGDGYPPGFPPGGDSDIFFQEGKRRYLLQREYLDTVAHSIPFYCVIGNHEGEQGWLYQGDSTSSAAQLTRARKEIFPNPAPGGFYSGNTDTVPGVGFREDYYAWEWGDALFVVLDPFWYTTTKPHNWNGPGSMNGWDWTLGKVQYDWLYETLQNSDATWKFVFTHHLTTTVSPACYGRGGVEVVKYSVDGNPTFEWGGEDESGNLVFDLERPDWQHGPVHDMLVENGVTIVFHGHDHFFAAQVLDGVVYQECPQPGDAEYTMGHAENGEYRVGELLPNSGHIRVTVSPRYVTVEYVRSFLAGEGENEEVAFRYTIPNHPHHSENVH
jgi:hypothetical protein